MEDEETSRDAAIREAFEEAGAIGTASSEPIGSFSYCKTFSSTEFRVSVHLIHVEATAADYPERDIRPSRWVSVSAAADEVDRATLRTLLGNLYN
ncbi:MULTISPECIES: NUDIX hydrolase [unclassified Sinorhizobium]|uniref:NUDIX hydrolase n=1 Tax=unclassified Sinorhizobium TaxID=2613772 RepID=UPI0035233ED2